ncbi:DUF1576 domain-containing protein [Natroniella sp. ANB-PHB2]|uniref:DUF1576 domain-containing protein n=1 Tax=Natroniella sp. ANB-PHB2 TaxID=3384444 RepID=UPI0038D47FFA
MSLGNSVNVSVGGKAEEGIIPKTIEATENLKFSILLGYAIVVLFSSLLFNTPREIIEGLYNLTLSPSVLVSDYIVIGNLGAALFNSGLLMIISIYIAKFSDASMNGTVIAAVLTVGGFAFFGKNFYNIWSIFCGVYLYAKVQGEDFGKFLLVALFGTALGPLVSQTTFGLGLPLVSGVILGNLLGIAAGFILPPLANHVVKFHQGFNIYNVGFTAGMVGSLFMSLFRAFGAESNAVSIVASGYNYKLGIYLTVLFSSMLVLGYLFNDRGFSGYDSLLESSGRLVDDYVTTEGFGLCFINMGLLGLLSTFYVLIIGGEISGSVVGGIFTIVGFGAFGKHLKNITPLLIGVYLASWIQTWEVTATGSLLAALFGTTLAPIAGEFGWKSGILAGFIHMAVVMNVGYLHGGMNLYNNGFAGGLVAAMLVPILVSLKKGN